MIVMPANSTHELVHLWSALYGGVGHLYTPVRNERIRPWLPYALDNGRYIEAVRGDDFDEGRFLRCLENYAFRDHRPAWVTVPDVPFDGEATVEWYELWAERLKPYNIPLAVAVQNGMTAETVRGLSVQPDVIFVGGTYDWKWQTVASWCKEFPRVHVGRVNSPDRLYQLAALGAESCDGSGWFRGGPPQVVGLGRFLAEQAGMDPVYADVCARSTRYIHKDQLTMTEMLKEYGDPPKIERAQA